MTARSNRSRRSTPSGRVTPKGTRTDRSSSAKPSPSDAAASGHARFGSPADQGVRPSTFRPPAPRSGTRGNR